MSAEWNFFATSHGKGPCDGVGGTAKRLATRACVQMSVTIQTAHEFYSFIRRQMLGTTFVYTDVQEHKQHEKKLKARFSKARTLPRTQGFHCIVPQGAGTVKAKRFTESAEFVIASVQA